MHLAKQNALWYPSGFPFFQTCQTHGYWMEKKPGLLDGINTYAQRNHMIFRLMQALPVPSTIQKYVGKRSWGIYLTKSLCQNIPRHTRNDALTIWYFAILHYFSYDSHIWHNYTTQEQPSNHKKMIPQQNQSNLSRIPRYHPPLPKTCLYLQSTRKMVRLCIR